MSASGRALVCVWACSGLAFLPAFDSPQLSRTALLLLPWLIWAGWPATDGSRPGRVPSGWIARVLPALALALPMLVLGMEIDLASGWDRGDLVHTSMAGLLLLGVFAAARAQFGRFGGRASLVYGVLWLITVLLLPLFLAVVQLGTPAPATWGTVAASVSPVGWGIGRLTLASAHAPAAVLDGAPSLALGLVAWGATVLLRRGGRA